MPYIDVEMEVSVRKYEVNTENLKKICADKHRMYATIIVKIVLGVRKENNMELISREDAIKCLDGNVLITEQKEAEAVKEYFEMVITRLKALPTIEERKEGKWVTEYNGNGWNDYWDYTCSVCGKKYERADVLCKANFCPNCGAKMERRTDE